MLDLSEAKMLRKRFRDVVVMTSVGVVKERRKEEGGEEAMQEGKGRCRLRPSPQ
jgi:hypothetical protein